MPARESTSNRADREGWRGRVGEKEQLLAVPRLKREWKGKRTETTDEKKEIFFII